MALAAFTLIQVNGAPPGVESDCNKHPSFCSADVQTEDPNTYPIAAPLDASESPNYSYEVWVKLRCSVAPDNEVSNIKGYGPSSQPDSGKNPANRLTVLAGTTGTYARPTDQGSTIATTSQHDNYYSPATGLPLAANTPDSVIDAVGEETELLVLQLQILDGAAQGNMTTWTWHWSYDES